VGLILHGFAINQTEKIMDWNLRRQTRFEGLSERIEYYLYLFQKRGKLSKPQIADLKDAADTISCIGEAGENYYYEVQEFLALHNF
jgi:hypothetical protein